MGPGHAPNVLHLPTDRGRRSLQWGAFKGLWEVIVRRVAVAASAVIAVGLITAGCSPSTEAENKTEDANAAVCLSLEGLNATIDGLASGVTGTGDVTVGKAQESINQIDQAYQTVEANLQKLGTDVQDQVLTAQQQFEEAQMQVQEGLSGLDGDSNLSDMPAEEAQNIQNLQKSYDELNSSLGCG